MNTSDFIYLDHAAATPLDPKVFKVMQPYFSDNFFNPSSPYAPSVKVKRDYEAAKHSIAQTIGTKPDELVMTAGATESINLSFSASKGGHVVTTQIEHQAVLAAASQCASVTTVAVDSSGIVTAKAVADAITPETTFISVGLANSELGTLQPLYEIARSIADERQRRQENNETTPLYFHSDASQGAGQTDIHPARLGLDMMTLNAGKMYGPKQVGLLWASNRVMLTPQIYGGGQERGLRSGTENVAGIIGFAKALELSEKQRKSESDRLKKIRDMLQRQLTDKFPSSVISGNQKHRLSGHLHISFPGLDAERLLFALESFGVLVATGSACAANKGTRSHVLTAIGMSDEIADGSLRISLGKLSTVENISRAAEHIIAVVTAEQARLSR